MITTPKRPLRILVAWQPHPTTRPDINTVADDLANTVAWLAAAQDVTVRTATVISYTWPQADSAQPTHATLGPTPGTATPTDNAVAQEAFDSWLTAEAESCAKEARTQLLAAGVPEETLDTEQPSVVISDHSETSRLIQAGQEFGADLLILGSRADAPSSYYRIGATADALLHCSTIPLLLVPHQAKTSKSGPNRVNCAYVDTEQSQQALRHAADMANQWGVPLRLVAFFPEGATMYPTQVPFEDATQSHSQQAIAEAWKQQATELLTRGRNRALSRHPGLEVELKTGAGDSWQEAIDMVKWKKGDLMVLGSSILGDFNRVFIGPSTNQILRHIPVPVFLSTV